MEGYNTFSTDAGGLNKKFEGDEAYKNTEQYKFFEQKGVAKFADTLFASGFINAGAEYFYEAPQASWEGLAEDLQALKEKTDALAADQTPEGRLAARAAKKAGGKKILDLREETD